MDREPLANSPAALAGLHAGDAILVFGEAEHLAHTDSRPELVGSGGRGRMRANGCQSDGCRSGVCHGKRYAPTF